MLEAIQIALLRECSNESIELNDKVINCERKTSPYNECVSE